MAPSYESGSFIWFNRRIHRTFILAMCILSLLMLVVYHQYNWSSISNIHLDKLASGGSGAVGGDPIAALDQTRVALLLETRPLPHIPALLAHFMSVLPEPWVFRFVGSPEANSLILASSSLSAHVKTGKLVITELPGKYAITDPETISMTLTDPTFYKDFLAPAKWLLVFQSDSIICAASKHNIEEYVSANYSWVGAPWNMVVKGGNGGLSLRHIPPILKVLEKEARRPGDPWEDRWICDRLLESDATKMPGPEVEATFSVESQWYEKPFGYHLIGSGKTLVPDIWDNKERRKHILQYCPEIKIALDMDLLREAERLAKEVEELKSPKTGAGKEKEKEKELS
ncbi:b99c60b2-5778-47e6-b109-220670ffff5f [Sclerotinia trifoliorum]|uniref:B99c60b2-5778-47e6-b109-220670ffff5f n=1 Tax=Sclerotinia trifoliorum TaxID=28548 RepID=A0A8H2VWY9_9HELO|nr:b99c60b2-5778-47e6-b109-220670ffff5f [Sclerotinia trifoliorum]